MENNCIIFWQAQPGTVSQENPRILDAAQNPCSQLQKKKKKKKKKER